MGMWILLSARLDVKWMRHIFAISLYKTNVYEVILFCLLFVNYICLIFFVLNLPWLRLSDLLRSRFSRGMTMKVEMVLKYCMHSNSSVLLFWILSTIPTLFLKTFPLLRLARFRLCVFCWLYHNHNGRGCKTLHESRYI